MTFWESTWGLYIYIYIHTHICFEISPPPKKRIWDHSSPFCISQPLYQLDFISIKVHIGSFHVVCPGSWAHLEMGAWDRHRDGLMDHWELIFAENSAKYKALLMLSQQALHSQCPSMTAKPGDWFIRDKQTSFSLLFSYCFLIMGVLRRVPRFFLAAKVTG